MRILQNRTALACITFISMVWLASLPARADEDRVLKVMTRNMDAGTDLAFIAVLPNIQDGVDATLAEIIASRPDLRAEFLANEIAAQQPDLIGLQEVTQIRTGPQGQTTVLYDQLVLLANALRARGLHYAVVAVNTLTDVEVPGHSTFVHYTDRDAVLARTDLQHSDLDISDVQTHIYETRLLFPVPGTPGIPVLRGWISANLKVRGKIIGFMNTHLESTYAFDPHGQLQSLQAAELLQSLSSVKTPIVLCGDFNANAEPVGPEQTPTPGLLQAAGFTDSWHALHPADPGYTWPIFNEDFFAILFGVPATPAERIDLVFTRNANAVSAVETGLLVPWASDHAGVAATIHFFK